MFQNNYTYDVCHEHLYDFGLINMNGRMYDPLTSSFLSPDIYVQDPTTQQGFNRYAYCMYNPLKYVDPSGYRYFGYDEAAYYRMIEEMAQRVFHEWYSVYEDAVTSVQLTLNMACCLYGHGLDTHASGSGHHGAAGGGSPISYKEFVEKCHQLGIEPGKQIPKEKLTNEFLKAFQEAFFPDAPMDYVKNFVLQNLTKGVDGQTNNIFDDNLFSTGYSDVYFNSNTDFTPESLFYAMGHELIHVSQNIETMGYPQSMLLDPSFIDVKEFWAHSWISATGGIDHYPINTTNMQLWSNHVNPLNHNETINYTNMMNFINFNWLNYIIHP